MSSKKGLSAEEKRARLLDLFHETKEFYKLQELEKLAPKLKGITAMSVKEVLTELVNESMVNLYWSFPSDTGASLNKSKEAATKAVNSLRTQRDSEARIIEREEAEREDTEERHALLSQVQVAEETLQKLEEENAKYSSCDPRMFAFKEKQVEDLKAIALNHTDNVSVAMSFFRDRFGEEARDGLKQQLGISEDFEELVF